ncbi:hypothetical protein ACGFYV_31330 [Streptomyces sp. NPDC048297]|uniref:hypothetical protein n=1 Tax=Streptomyces sp. NPDC048297 TaxID=3365531 RepID=UPI00372422CD
MHTPLDAFAAFDPSPPSDRASVPTQLPTAASRLRRRLVGINVAAASTVLALSWTVRDGLATRVTGPLTLGMILLALYTLTLCSSALWYDRACAVQCDPLVTGDDEQEQR